MENIPWFFHPPGKRMSEILRWKISLVASIRRVSREGLRLLRWEISLGTIVPFSF